MFPQKFFYLGLESRSRLYCSRPKQCDLLREEISPTHHCVFGKSHCAHIVKYPIFFVCSRFRSRGRLWILDTKATEALSGVSACIHTTRRSLCLDAKKKNLFKYHSDSGGFSR